MTRLLLFLYRIFCICEGSISLLRGNRHRRSTLSFSSPLRDKLEAIKNINEKRSLLVYAPTIGEFNSVKPVIRLYQQQWPDDRLVLLTCYEQYLDLLIKNFPEAIVGLPNFRSPWLIDRFFSRTKPRLFIISEGPALHCCFPQRLEVALPAACLARRIPVIVTNAMYFEKSIASRLDYIENTFFSRLFTESIRFWFPPFPKFQQTLVKEGAPNNRVQVMGDLRFDSLNVAGAPKNADLKQILERYRLVEGPLLVAGSVNYIDEWKCLVGAWQALKIHYPHTKLIIAPRYVNEPKVINALVSLLTTENIDFVLRSNPLSNLELKDVLVVDVFGELSHYYSIASISYIGRNHGVLEPLAYSCPTIVGKGWRQDYSAYPLYEYMVSQQGVICIEDQADLVQVTERLLEDQSFRNQCIQTARRLVAENAGAAERMMSVITKSLNHH